MRSILIRIIQEPRVSSASPPPASLNQKRRNIKICDRHSNHHRIHLHTMMKIHLHTTMTSAGCACTVDLTKMAIKFCTNVHNAIDPPYEIEEVGLGRAG